MLTLLAYKSLTEDLTIIIFTSLYLLLCSIIKFWYESFAKSTLTTVTSTVFWWHGYNLKLRSAPKTKTKWVWTKKIT